MRSWDGPTGQPGLHVPETSDGLTVATVPTNEEEFVGLAVVGVPVVVGEAAPGGVVVTTVFEDVVGGDAVVGGDGVAVARGCV
jgi:hypothetical protein